MLEGEAVEVGDVADAAEADLGVEAVMILARRKGMLVIRRVVANTTSCLTRTTDDGIPIDMEAAVVTGSDGTEMTSDEIGVGVATSIETRGGLTEDPNADDPVREVRMMPEIETGTETGGIAIDDNANVVNGVSAHHCIN